MADRHSVGSGMREKSIRASAMGRTQGLPFSSGCLKDENIPELLDAASYDFVVDAIDTLSPKCHLIAEAMKLSLIHICDISGATVRPHWKILFGGLH